MVTERAVNRGAKNKVARAPLMPSRNKTVVRPAPKARKGTPAKPLPARSSVSTVSTEEAVDLFTGDYRAVEYRKNIDAFVRDVANAPPMTLVETERAGVSSRFIKDLPERMRIPATRLYSMLGIPKATIEKKAATNQALTGMGGKSALGMARLLGIARSIVANSTSPDAEGFDSVAWLGQWLDREQPALGGRKPGDLIDTPTGVEVVARLLGALESGAYQ